MKIVEGVHQVDGVNGNVYLIEDGTKLVLIDTGFPRSAKKIENYIKKAGFNLSAVSTIVLTHYHIDHVGNAKKLKQQTNAKIAVHEAEADFVAHRKAPPKPKKFMAQLTSTLKPAAVEPDVLLKDGDKIGNLQVIHTPGHSPGSISLYDPERKVMFVGDAVFFFDGQVEGPDAQFTLDMSEAEKSIGHLSTFDFDVMLSGHGEPLTESASEKVKGYYALLKQP